MLSRCRCHILESQTQPLGLHYELLKFFLEQLATFSGARARAFRHHCANAQMHLEYSFRYQLRHHPMSCIGIDFKSFAQFSYGGKRVADTQLG